jgi:hypothetical protein
MSGKKNRFIKEMEELKDLLDRRDKEIDLLEERGFYIEAPIFNITWEFESMLLKLISQKYDINVEALGWFIADNEWGKKEYACSRENCKDVKICNASDFWDFEKSI